LGQRDLQAVILRFYEHKTVTEVGTALGISEEGAKKRLSRAVLKLRSTMMKNGITIPADALGAAIQASTAISAAPAPVPLTHTIMQSSLNAGHGVKSVALAKSAMSSLTYAGIKWFAVATVALVIGTTVGGTWLAVSRGQSSPSVPPGPAPTSAPTTAASPDVLAINDRLRVTFEGFTVRPPNAAAYQSIYTPLVDPSGTLAMPMILPIPVAGLSISDTEKKIGKAYIAANLPMYAKIHIERIERGVAPLTGRGALNSGDHVICHIADLDGPGLESRIPQTISTAGQISLPYVGNVQIQGKSESEAATAIADAYRNANLLSNAQVELVREQPKSILPRPAGVPGGER
jgi:protein involved in polysaccharide export with SLBB domain